MITTRKICECLHTLEKGHDLLNWQICGVNIWPVIRITLYYDLTKITDLYQGMINTGRPARKDYISKLIRLFMSFWHNPFFILGKKPYAVFVHQRKVGGRDIYTQPLLDELSDQALILDNSYNGGQPLDKAGDMAFFVTLAVIYRKIMARLYTFSKQDLSLIHKLEQHLKEELGIHYTLSPLIKRKLFLFLFLKPLYKTLFRLKNVRYLYIVNAYSNCHITAAAHALGIKVSEIQHGLITPYHMGYSYPNQKTVPYFPDEFLSFGAYWGQSVQMPASVQCRVIGAPHIETLRKKNVAKIPCSLFFSSQTVIGNEVFDFAVKTAKLLPEYSITLNIHPLDHPEKYRRQLESCALDNLKMTYKPEGFFELLASHEFQAGSFSTTLFEGMVLGNKVIVLDLPGAENMAPMIERGDALLAHSPEELVRCLKNAKVVTDAELYYAPPINKIVA